MSRPRVSRERLLNLLEQSWKTLRDSYEGMPEKALLEPGVVGQSQLDESSVVGGAKGSRTSNPGVVRSNPTQPSSLPAAAARGSTSHRAPAFQAGYAGSIPVSRPSAH